MRYQGETVCCLCGHVGVPNDFTRYDYDGDRICILCQIELDKERHARNSELPYYLKNDESRYSESFGVFMGRRNPKAWDCEKSHHIPEWGVCETRSRTGEVPT